MSEDKTKGIVYLLTNECMPGLVKIGMTSREDVVERMKELYTTGVPVRFECAYACRLTKFKEFEAALHIAFEPQRVNKSREFFRIKPSQAISILKLVGEDITADVIREMENSLTEEEQDNQRKKRCALNFYEMGLKDGDELTYLHDYSQKCMVVGSRKVEYNGKQTSLTAVTTELLNSKWSVQPTPHWLVGDKSLSELYEEWQVQLLREGEEEA